MAKIPFDIKFRPQIESGEYKVETRDGKPVRIICWDRAPKIGDGLDLTLCVLIPRDNGEAVYYYNHSGKSRLNDERYDLLIITPEPELSEMEVHLLSWLSDDTKGEIPMERMKELVRNRAAELLDLAKKELVDDMQLQFDDEINEAYYRGRKDGKAEALNGLPMWRKWGNGACGNSDGHPIALVAGYGGIRFVSCLGTTGEKYIFLSDLKKLPGFNED